ncbi:hypothetical protein [Kitasatospora indigofera]|uniref:hypothetical protein n=1 Tax=Kitasatospora indigofera TaxID=67307 RepID=UPI00369F75FD
MTLTTIKVQSAVRDDLARLAADDLGGVTLGAALEHLLIEYRKARVLAAFARLRADPEAWGSYQGELDVWDGAPAGGES